MSVIWRDDKKLEHKVLHKFQCTKRKFNATKWNGRNYYESKAYWGARSLPIPLLYPWWSVWLKKHVSVVYSVCSDQSTNSLSNTAMLNVYAHLEPPDRFGGLETGSSDILSGLTVQILRFTSLFGKMWKKFAQVPIQEQCQPSRFSLLLPQ